MPDHRARITAGELAVVCSRYELDAVKAARPLHAGSRASPKALITTASGSFLLKRRAAPRQGAARADWLHRIAVSHEVILHLAARGLPVPRLIGTRDDHNTMLHIGDDVYELYQFVDGRAYDRRPPAGAAAGDLLSRCHAALRSFAPTWPPPRRGYHAHPQLIGVLRSLPETLNNPDLTEITSDLADRYQRAAAAASEAGVDRTEQTVHGDWHPGNLIFAEDGTIAAILDFDAVSLAPQLADAANGALQFALRRRPLDNPAPNRAPFAVDFDPALFRAFWGGYRQADPAAAVTLPWPAVPWLCIQAMIVEVTLPIAATGQFGRFAGPGVLRLVRRTAAWLESHAITLARWATNP